MPLVDYSESDTSQPEDGPSIEKLHNPRKRKVPKPSEHKIVGKIRVDVQKISEEDGGGKGLSRLKMGSRGPGDGGFNSFLPPPVRTSSTIGQGARRIEEEISNIESIDGHGNSSTRFAYQDVIIRTDPNGETAVTALHGRSEASIEDVDAKQKPLLFRPLSVARKQVKKKKTSHLPPAPVMSDKLSSDINVNRPELQSDARVSRLSLFSIERSTSGDDPEQNLTSVYSPVIHGTMEQVTSTTEHGNDLADTNVESTMFTPKGNLRVSQSLAEIASDLGLSTADRRQLLGRKSASQSTGQSSAASVINFNTDEEYKHNNELRATGEQALHNPVRSIAGGKHSLKQLVSAAVSQKDALEESFAKGKSNRAEAGNRYGW